ncbi:MAG TPA: class I SAM-dependent methyltransferase [Syntrophorhabdus sp.]|nr:class I SAM-dependent methyltransferase [Syntrophorhabdus sp.]HQH83879.1 class I SAM-dependent methyltransferase [Syntrophorhabdus sp.]
MDEQSIRPLARNGVHEKVIAYLADKPRGRILDVPTGQGALAKKLHEVGFTVSCCDIEPAQFLVKGLTVEKGDLNGRLPYGDEEFDYVCFLEAIEHMENPYNAVREVTRVLKRGGTLALSTPNYLNIERRMKFLITGFFTKPVSHERFLNACKGRTYGLHLSPLGYTLIRFALEASGLKIVHLTYDMKKPKIIFFKPLTLFIRLYTRFWSKDKQKEYWFDETTSKVILEGGNTLIIFAEKV